MPCTKAHCQCNKAFKYNCKQFPQIYNLTNCKFLTFTFRKEWRSNRAETLYYRTVHELIKHLQKICPPRHDGQINNWKLVPELQNDGTLHYHVLLCTSNFLTLKAFKNYWSHWGNVDEAPVYCIVSLNIYMKKENDLMCRKLEWKNRLLCHMSQGLVRKNLKYLALKSLAKSRYKRANQIDKTSIAHYFAGHAAAKPPAPISKRSAVSSARPLSRRRRPGVGRPCPT